MTTLTYFIALLAACAAGFAWFELSSVDLNLKTSMDRTMRSDAYTAPASGLHSSPAHASTSDSSVSVLRDLSGAGVSEDSPSTDLVLSTTISHTPCPTFDAGAEEEELSPLSLPPLRRIDIASEDTVVTTDTPTTVDFALLADDADNKAAVSTTNSAQQNDGVDVLVQEQDDFPIHNDIIEVATLDASNVLTARASSRPFSFAGRVPSQQSAVLSPSLAPSAATQRLPQLSSMLARSPVLTAAATTGHTQQQQDAHQKNDDTDKKNSASSKSETKAEKAARMRDKDPFKRYPKIPRSQPSTLPLVDFTKVEPLEAKAADFLYEGLRVIGGVPAFDRAEVGVRVAHKLYLHWYDSRQGGLLKVYTSTMSELAVTVSHDMGDLPPQLKSKPQSIVKKNTVYRAQFAMVTVMYTPQRPTVPARDIGMGGEIRSSAAFSHIAELTLFTTAFEMTTRILSRAVPNRFGLKPLTSVDAAEKLTPATPLVFDIDVSHGLEGGGSGRALGGGLGGSTGAGAAASANGGRSGGVTVSSVVPDRDLFVVQMMTTSVSTDDQSNPSGVHSHTPRGGAAGQASAGAGTVSEHVTVPYGTKATVARVVFVPRSECDVFGHVRVTLTTGASYLLWYNVTVRYPGRVVHNFGAVSDSEQRFVREVFVTNPSMLKALSVVDVWPQPVPSSDQDSEHSMDWAVINNAYTPAVDGAAAVPYRCIEAAPVSAAIPPGQRGLAAIVTINARACFRTPSLQALRGFARRVVGGLAIRFNDSVTTVEDPPLGHGLSANSFTSPDARVPGEHGGTGSQDRAGASGSGAPTSTLATWLQQIGVDHSAGSRQLGHRFTLDVLSTGVHVVDRFGKPVPSDGAILLYAPDKWADATSIGPAGFPNNGTTEVLVAVPPAAELRSLRVDAPWLSQRPDGDRVNIPEQAYDMSENTDLAPVVRLGLIKAEKTALPLPHPHTTFFSSAKSPRTVSLPDGKVMEEQQAGADLGRRVFFPLNRSMSTSSGSGSSSPPKKFKEFGFPPRTFEFGYATATFGVHMSQAKVGTVTTDEPPRSLHKVPFTVVAVAAPVLFYDAHSRCFENLRILAQHGENGHPASPLSEAIAMYSHPSARGAMRCPHTHLSELNFGVVWNRRRRSINVAVVNPLNDTVRIAMKYCPAHLSVDIFHPLEHEYQSALREYEKKKQQRGGGKSKKGSKGGKKLPALEKPTRTDHALSLAPGEERQFTIHLSQKIDMPPEITELETAGVMSFIATVQVAGLPQYNLHLPVRYVYSRTPNGLQQGASMKIKTSRDGAIKFPWAGRQLGAPPREIGALPAIGVPPPTVIDELNAAASVTTTKLTAGQETAATAASDPDAAPTQAPDWSILDKEHLWKIAPDGSSVPVKLNAKSPQDKNSDAKTGDEGIKASISESWDDFTTILPAGNQGAAATNGAGEVKATKTGMYAVYRNITVENTYDVTVPITRVAVLEPLARSHQQVEYGSQGLTTPAGTFEASRTAEVTHTLAEHGSYRVIWHATSVPAKGSYIVATVAFYPTLAFVKPAHIEKRPRTHRTWREETKFVDQPYNPNSVPELQVEIFPESQYQFHRRSLRADPTAASNPSSSSAQSENTESEFGESGEVNEEGPQALKPADFFHDDVSPVSKLFDRTPGYAHPVSSAFAAGPSSQDQKYDFRQTFGVGPDGGLHRTVQPFETSRGRANAPALIRRKWKRTGFMSRSHFELSSQEVDAYEGHRSATDVLDAVLVVAFGIHEWRARLTGQAAAPKLYQPHSLAKVNAIAMHAPDAGAAPHRGVQHRLRLTNTELVPVMVQPLFLHEAVGADQKQLSPGILTALQGGALRDVLGGDPYSAREMERAWDVPSAQFSISLDAARASTTSTSSSTSSSSSRVAIENDDEDVGGMLPARTIVIPPRTTVELGAIEFTPPAKNRVGEVHRNVLLLRNNLTFFEIIHLKAAVTARLPVRPPLDCPGCTHNATVHQITTDEVDNFLPRAGGVPEWISLKRHFTVAPQLLSLAISSGELTASLDAWSMLWNTPVHQLQPRPHGRAGPWGNANSQNVQRAPSTEPVVFKFDRYDFTLGKGVLKAVLINGVPCGCVPSSTDSDDTEGPASPSNDDPNPSRFGESEVSIEGCTFTNAATMNTSDRTTARTSFSSGAVHRGSEQRPVTGDYGRLTFLIRPSYKSRVVKANVTLIVEAEAEHEGPASTLLYERRRRRAKASGRPIPVDPVQMVIKAIEMPPFYAVLPKHRQLLELQGEVGPVLTAGDAVSAKFKEPSTVITALVLLFGTVASIIEIVLFVLSFFRARRAAAFALGPSFMTVFAAAARYTIRAVKFVSAKLFVAVRAFFIGVKTVTTLLARKITAPSPSTSSPACSTKKDKSHATTEPASKGKGKKDTQHHNQQGQQHHAPGKAAAHDKSHGDKPTGGKGKPKDKNAAGKGSSPKPQSPTPESSKKTSPVPEKPSVTKSPAPETAAVSTPTTSTPTAHGKNTTKSSSSPTTTPPNETAPTVNVEEMMQDLITNEESVRRALSVEEADVRQGLVVGAAMSRRAADAAAGKRLLRDALAAVENDDDDDEPTTPPPPHAVELEAEPELQAHAKSQTQVFVEADSDDARSKRKAQSPPTQNGGSESKGNHTPSTSTEAPKASSTPKEKTVAPSKNDPKPPAPKSQQREQQAKDKETPPAKQPQQPTKQQQAQAQKEKDQKEQKEQKEQQEKEQRQRLEARRVQLEQKQSRTRVGMCGDETGARRKINDEENKAMNAALTEFRTETARRVKLGSERRPAPTLPADAAVDAPAQRTKTADKKPTVASEAKAVPLVSVAESTPVATAVTPTVAAAKPTTPVASLVASVTGSDATKSPERAKPKKQLDQPLQPLQPLPAPQTADDSPNNATSVTDNEVKSTVGPASLAVAADTAAVAVTETADDESASTTSPLPPATPSEESVSCTTTELKDPKKAAQEEKKRKKIEAQKAKELAQQELWLKQRFDPAPAASSKKDKKKDKKPSPTPAAPARTEIPNTQHSGVDAKTAGRRSSNAAEDGAVFAVLREAPPTSATGTIVSIPTGAVAVGSNSTTPSVSVGPALLTAQGLEHLRQQGGLDDVSAHVSPAMRPHQPMADQHKQLEALQSRIHKQQQDEQQHLLLMQQQQQQQRQQQQQMQRQSSTSPGRPQQQQQQHGASTATATAVAPSLFSGDFEAVASIWGPPDPSSTANTTTVSPSAKAGTDGNSGETDIAALLSRLRSTGPKTASADREGSHADRDGSSTGQQLQQGGAGRQGASQGQNSSAPSGRDELFGRAVFGQAQGGHGDQSRTQSHARGDSGIGTAASSSSNPPRAGSPPLGMPGGTFLSFASVSSGNRDSAGSPDPQSAMLTGAQLPSAAAGGGSGAGDSGPMLSFNTASGKAQREGSAAHGGRGKNGPALPQHEFNVSEAVAQQALCTPPGPSPFQSTTNAGFSGLAPLPAPTQGGPVNTSPPHHGGPNTAQVPPGGLMMLGANPGSGVGPAGAALPPHVSLPPHLTAEQRQQIIAAHAAAAGPPPPVAPPGMVLSHAATSNAPPSNPNAPFANFGNHDHGVAGRSGPGHHNQRGQGNQGHGQGRGHQHSQQPEQPLMQGGGHAFVQPPDYAATAQQAQQVQQQMAMVPPGGTVAGADGTPYVLVPAAFAGQLMAAQAQAFAQVAQQQHQQQHQGQSPQQQQQQQGGAGGAVPSGVPQVSLQMLRQQHQQQE